MVSMVFVGKPKMSVSIDDNFYDVMLVVERTHLSRWLYLALVN